jgi:hypothetical protein
MQCCIRMIPELLWFKIYKLREKLRTFLRPSAGI